MAVSEIIVNPNGGGTPCKIGTFTISTTGEVTISDVGFKPKQIAIVFQGSGGTSTTVSNGAGRYIYDERISNSYVHRGIKTGTGTMSADSVALTAGNVGITEVNDNGFKFAVPNNVSNPTYFYGTYYYMAIG